MPLHVHVVLFLMAVNVGQICGVLLHVDAGTL